jgi:hypothetical protein
MVEDETGAAMEMPRYKSHKTVWALEIDTVSVGAPYRMKPKDVGYAEITLPEEMWSRYQPVSGDFYVVYADGYKSFSPRKAFLEGYTRDDMNALELGAAVRAAGLAGD